MAEDTSRVLIADDNKVNRLLLSRSVELLGHRFALAENVALPWRSYEAKRSIYCCSTSKCPNWTVSQCSSRSRPTHSCVKCQSS